MTRSILHAFATLHSTPRTCLRYPSRTTWSGACIGREITRRIYRYFNCSAECYILSLIYIDRLIHSDSFIMNGFSAYRVVLTSSGRIGGVTPRLMLSAKFFDDVYFTNAYYAEIGGIPVTELNSLEVDFLCRIHFSLSVSPQEYQRYYNDLSGHCRSCLNCCTGWSGR